jgi:hypothetical protein
MLAMCLIIAFPTFATSVTYNFGMGTGVTSPTWPGYSNAATGSASAIGVLINTPIVLDSGSLQITGSGTVDCAQGTATGTCGYNSSPSTSQAYGLGIGDGRINDTSEQLIFTVIDPADWTVSLYDFSVTGFSPNETVRYVLDNGSPNTFPGPTPNVGLDTPNPNTINHNPFTTLTFSAAAGSYSLAEVTFDITRKNSSSPVPEPATILFLGSGIIGIGLASWRRKK